ncbi:MAG: C69 family dipeptidase [Halobacteriales archaeon]|nr:C69 family dipeptidase [Halobacteriales archaeon]
MCDTIVATPSATRDGVTLFGKNSDREPNEAHEVVRVPAKRHDEQTVSCTYIDMPQVERTSAVVLSKPFWIWGAEMGANEHGVVIGNEALFTRLEVDDGGLLGMDLLRLALERAASADEAVNVITDLLEKHGQGGDGGMHEEFYYHNSFLVADADEAWILETAGEHWVAKRVEGVYSVSNRPTVADDFDRASENVVSHAVEMGWCDDEDDFCFDDCYTDSLYTRFSGADSRRRCTTARLDESEGDLTVENFIETLRDHGGSSEGYRPDRGVLGILGSEVCMHAGYGPVRRSQTTGSMVSRLSANSNDAHFVTGTAAPCTSVFKPVWVDAPVPDTGPSPTDEADEESLFWRHERLHRETLRDYPTRIVLYDEERDTLENKMVEGAVELAEEEASASERDAYSEDCFEKADGAIEDWTRRVTEASVESKPKSLFRRAWNEYNERAGLRLPDGRL